MKKTKASRVLDNLTVDAGRMEHGHQKRAEIQIASARKNHNQVLGYLGTTRVGKASRMKGPRRKSELDIVHI